ncbi:hypothetical protein [Ideonella sp.]|uniref:hypothetical protein n=1 Tax=Ideonella sp. TaxID=1929293 RepID=UPI0035AD8A99
MPTTPAHDTPDPSDDPAMLPAAFPSPIPAAPPWSLPLATRPLRAAEPAGPLGGWHASSLDLRLGLEVRDLGPVEWLEDGPALGGGPQA